MKNPETLATLDTCETGQNQIKHKNTDNWNEEHNGPH